MMYDRTLVGRGPAVVRKFLLTEDAPFTMIPGATVLHSEVVSSNDVEVLEVWLALPTAFNEPVEPELRDQPQPTTIYNNTMVYEDIAGARGTEEHEDDEYYYE